MPVPRKGAPQRKAAAKRYSEQRDPLQTKFHRTRHEWTFTMQPEASKDMEKNPRKYYKDKTTVPALALRYRKTPVIPGH